MVTARGQQRADVGITAGRIAVVGDVGKADQDIDARGLLLLPGCVDLHTHLASTPTWAPLDGLVSTASEAKSAMTLSASLRRHAST